MLLVSCWCCWNFDWEGAEAGGLLVGHWVQLHSVLRQWRKVTMCVESRRATLEQLLPFSASAQTWRLRLPGASARFQLATMHLLPCSIGLLNHRQYSHPWVGLVQVFEQQLYSCPMASSFLVLPLGLRHGQALAAPGPSHRPTKHAGLESHKALILLEQCGAGSLFFLVPERPRCKSESHRSLCSDLEADLALYYRELIS